MAGDPKERRAHPREALGLRVAMSIAGLRYTVPAILDNISLGGCYFVAPVAQVTEGSTVSVAFAMKPSGWCKASGTIVRFRRGEGFGVKFDEINEAMHEFIMTLGCTSDEGRAEVAAAIAVPEVLVIP